MTRAQKTKTQKEKVTCKSVKKTTKKNTVVQFWEDCPADTEPVFERLWFGTTVGCDTQKDDGTDFLYYNTLCYEIGFSGRYFEDCPALPLLKQHIFLSAKFCGTRGGKSFVDVQRPVYNSEYQLVCP